MQLTKRPRGAFGAACASAHRAFRS